MSRFSFGLLVLLAATSPAAAVTYVGQSRRVEALTGAVGGGIGDGETKSTADPELWVDSATASPTNPNASASVSQTSNIASSEITMSGAFSASTSSTVGAFAAQANSILSAQFSIASNTPYESMLATSGDSVESFSFVQLGGGGSYGANSSGILTPSTYRLQLNFVANATGDQTVSGVYAYSLEFISPSTQGDYNRDGIVDAADYVVWRSQLDDLVDRYTGADSNGDGVVDNDDYQTWRSNFGNEIEPAVGGGSATTIPEPTSAALFLAGMMFLVFRRMNTADTQSCSGSASSSG
jgi:hypothetical protein